jgi:preprotein translocase subunit SecE
MKINPIEVKKPRPMGGTSSADSIPLSDWKPQEIVSEIKDEFKKITWTNPEELKTYTQIVVAATFVLGIGIYFIDLCIHSLLNTLAYAIKLITG